MTDTRDNSTRYFGDAVYVAGDCDGRRLHPDEARVYRLANTAGGTVQMTEVEHLANGTELLIVNESGANSLLVDDANAVTVINIAATKAARVWLADNTAAISAWLAQGVTLL